jgi:hypothetical protein
MPGTFTFLAEKNTEALEASSLTTWRYIPLILMPWRSQKPWVMASSLRGFPLQDSELICHFQPNNGNGKNCGAGDT